MSTFSKKVLPDLINQSEAARLRGVSRQAIFKLVKKGRLKTYEVGGTLFLRKSEVLAFEGRRGRPAKNNGKTKTKK